MTDARDLTEPTDADLDGPVAVTGAGRVRGFRHGTSAVYLGVPFAEPPVGELRFLAPTPVLPWTGVRDALRYGPTPQRRESPTVTTIPEPSVPGDGILCLNVFTPAPSRAVGPGLPVLVWIHGGGYGAGSPASPWYDGAAFNRDGVVVVTIAYRLGFEGFGWIDGAPLNRGILDQIAALEWVRDNIRAFGGDPQRVTVGGQSAGAGSALALLSSRRAVGLFHGVIAQSAPAYGLTVAAAEDIGRRFAARHGITPDLAAWRTVSADAILDTEATATHGGPGTLDPTMPLDALIRAAHDPDADITGIPFAPVVDGDVVLPLGPAIEAGQNAQLPLLIGSTAHEFTFPSTEGLDDVTVALERAGVPTAAVARFRSAVASIGAEFGRGQLTTTALFRQPTLATAERRVASGAGENTWLYDFTYRAPATTLSGHCIDLPFAWDLLHAPGVSASVGDGLPQGLADTMHAAWVRFISAGDAAWPVAAAHPHGAMRFDTRSEFDTGAYGLDAALAESSAAAD
ncbi:carboxylesterase family protein [Cryobacterium sp. 1639]|uniref:carboxylesterase/lipase family protein n=1 Tax=Cryobacterium inferilacus TaxID=2866629 RepID=UPI001C73CED1|nr:carboxylesterase family protein [Cryobacterium sp. 1639]MBX0300783.1 carboxylesterase family protein [Cryobacterium sp. 1639]